MSRVRASHLTGVAHAEPSRRRLARRLSADALAPQSPSTCLGGEGCPGAFPRSSSGFYFSSSPTMSVSVWDAGESSLNRSVRAHENTTATTSPPFFPHVCQYPASRERGFETWRVTLELFATGHGRACGGREGYGCRPLPAEPPC